MRDNLQSVQNELTLHIQWYNIFFKQSVQVVLLPCFTERFVENALSSDHIGLIENKINLLVKTVLPYKILKQKRFPRNSYSKGFTRFEVNVSGAFCLQRSCRHQLCERSLLFAVEYPKSLE